MFKYCVSDHAGELLPTSRLVVPAGMRTSSCYPTTPTEISIVRKYHIAVSPPQSVAALLPVVLHSPTMHPVSLADMIEIRLQNVPVFRVFCKQKDSGGMDIEIGTILVNDNGPRQPLPSLLCFKELCAAISKLWKSVLPGLFAKHSDGWWLEDWAFEEMSRMDGTDIGIIGPTLCITPICVVGSRSVGKTSLSKSLTHNWPSLDHKKDHKIAVNIYSASFIELQPRSHEGLRHVVKFCDYEGDGDLQSIQQVFYTKSSVYFICIDQQAYTAAYEQAIFLTDNDEEVDAKLVQFVAEKVMEYFETITSIRPNATLVLVGTKIDKLKGNQFRLDKMRKDMAERIDHWFLRFIRDCQKCRETVELSWSDNSEALVQVLDNRARSLKEKRCKWRDHAWIGVSCASEESVAFAQRVIRDLVIRSQARAIMPKAYTTLFAEFKRRRATLGDSPSRIERLAVPFHQVCSSFLSSIEQTLTNHMDVEVELQPAAFLSLLRAVGEVMKFEDLHVPDLEQDVFILDPQLIVEHMRVIVMDDKAVGEVLPHNILRSLPLWKQSTTPKRKLAWKKVFQHLGLIFPTSHPMNYNSCLLVPAYWKRTHEYWAPIRPLPSREPRKTRHVKWFFDIQTEFPSGILDQIVTETYNATRGRTIQLNAVTLEVDDFVCRLACVGTEIFVEGMSPIDCDDGVWDYFRDYYIAVEVVLRRRPGMDVKTYAVVKTGPRYVSITDAVKGLSRSRVHGINWLPPIVDWCREVYAEDIIPIDVLHRFHQNPNPLPSDLPTIDQGTIVGVDLRSTRSHRRRIDQWERLSHQVLLDHPGADRVSGSSTWLMIAIVPVVAIVLGFCWNTKPF